MHPPIPHTRTEIDPRDEAAVLEVMRRRVLVEADRTAALEDWFRQQFDAPDAVATGSCSQALVMALRAVGAGPGTEVILPSYVCAQVLAAVEHAGATGVVVDVGEDWMIDPAAVAGVVGPKTAAIIAAQMFGMFRDFTPLRDFGLPLIEDCAQSFPDWRSPQARMSGDIVVFSFEATKPVAGGEGGMALVRVPDLVGAMRPQKRFRDTPYRANFYSMSNLAAALVQSQLDRYPETLARRAEIAAGYIDGLDAIHPELVSSPVRGAPAWHRFLLRVRRDPEELIAAFSGYGIAVRRPVEVPLHRLCPDTVRAPLPVCDRLWETTISLPIYPELTSQQQGRVLDACRTLLS